MKRVGEVALSRVPARKTMEYHLAQKTKIPMVCLTCGVTERVAQGKLAIFHKKEFHCFQCRKAERDEFNKNLIELARRKGLIAPKK
jgi:hypothetical protein